MKIRFTDYVSEIWLPDCFKLAINEKNDNDATISRNDVIVKFFDGLLFLLLNLITGPCLMSISITGSGVMTIFFYKELTRNLENGNTPAGVLPNIWRLGQVRDTKFGMNVSRMLQNVRVTAFTFTVLLLQGGKITPSPTQIRVNKLHFNLHDQRLWHKRKQKKNRKQKF